MTRESYFTELVCSGCGDKFDQHKIQTFCPKCRATLVSNYDLKSAGAHLDRDVFRCRPAGMWRWHELLPVLAQGHLHYALQLLPYLV